MLELVGWTDTEVDEPETPIATVAPIGIVMPSITVGTVKTVETSTTTDVGKTIEPSDNGKEMTLGRVNPLPSRAPWTAVGL
jgi:hypothetical protein